MGESSSGAAEESGRFFALPSTPLGSWSAWLLLAALTLIVLNSAVVMPITEATSGLDSIQRVVNLTVFLFVFAAGVVGAVSIALKRERSWVAFAAPGLLVLALAFNLG